MDYKDYYKLMGVNKSSTAKEIKQAYRRLAKKYHPDVNPGNKEAEQNFKDVNEAYEVLGDVEKRKKYDELGTNWKQYEQWQQAGGQPGGQPFDWGQSGYGGGGAHSGYRTMTEEEMSSLFGDSDPFSGFYHTFFGGHGPGAKRQYRTAARPRRGQDIEQPVEISLEEAFAGTTRILQMTDSNGQPRRLEAKIPPGVQDGSRVRMAGQGMPGGGGGPSGDLYLTIQVSFHPFFERKGDDLHIKLNVPLTTVVLGGEVEVPTLKSIVMLKIPPETQNGKSFRLKGRGMPKIGNPQQFGDLYAEVKVVLPQQLSDKERKLFEEFASLHPADKYKP